MTRRPPQVLNSVLRLEDSSFRIYSMCVALILVSIFSSSFVYADECDAWFAKSHLSSSDSDCVLDCMALKVDMATFDCHDRCEKLCKPKDQSANALSSISDVAGLSKAELKLIATHPNEARIAYAQVELAQEMTKKRFDRDWFDDESDAYRHFVWTGLLVKELGEAEAKLFLDAHESGSQPDDPGTVMDRKNNDFAMKEAGRLKKGGQLDSDRLDKAAVQALKDKKLVVVRPLGGPKK